MQRQFPRINFSSFMGTFVLVVFWLAVIFAFSVLTPKTAVCFAGLWVLGFIIAAISHIAPYFFLATKLYWPSFSASCLNLIGHDP